MHPVLLRELAAEHVKSMTAVAGTARLARQLRDPSPPPPPGAVLAPAADVAQPAGHRQPDRLADTGARELAGQRIS